MLKLLDSEGVEQLFYCVYCDTLVNTCPHQMFYCEDCNLIYKNGANPAAWKPKMPDLNYIFATLGAHSRLTGHIHMTVAVPNKLCDIENHKNHKKV